MRSRWSSSRPTAASASGTLPTTPHRRFDFSDSINVMLAFVGFGAVLTTAVRVKQRHSRLSVRPMASLVCEVIGHSPQSAGQVEHSSSSSHMPSPHTKIKAQLRDVFFRNYFIAGIMWEKWRFTKNTWENVTLKRPNRASLRWYCIWISICSEENERLSFTDRSRRSVARGSLRIEMVREPCPLCLWRPVVLQNYALHYSTAHRSLALSWESWPSNLPTAGSTVLLASRATCMRPTRMWAISEVKPGWISTTCESHTGINTSGVQLIVI